MRNGFYLGTRDGYLMLQDPVDITLCMGYQDCYGHGSMVKWRCSFEVSPCPLLHIHAIDFNEIKTVQCSTETNNAK